MANQARNFPEPMPSKMPLVIVISIVAIIAAVVIALWAINFHGDYTTPVLKDGTYSGTVVNVNNNFDNTVLMDIQGDGYVVFYRKEISDDSQVVADLASKGMKAVVVIKYGRVKKWKWVR